MVESGACMAKMIQICASQNDLFGLDNDGMVYQYNFKTHTWMTIGHGRSDGPEGPLVERDPRSSKLPRSPGSAPPDAEPPSGRSE